jgi:hypothetical protein
VVKQYFRGARNGLASGDAPAGAGQLFSAYLYQFPTFKDLANITNSTLNDEATIRADVRASLTSCYNADIAYIASGHIVDNCTVAQMGYICNEIALDTRFVPMTFGQFADWLSQRASMSADLEQWKTPYVAWTHWRSADLTKMTVTVIPGGGPDGLDCVRLQNPSGSDVLYSFNNARITGETMTASCWVKSDTGSSQASAYAIRCSGQQSSLFTANTGWVRAQFAATAPTSTTTSSSGVNVKAGKSLYLAMYQLELGSGATAYEHPPL